MTELTLDSIKTEARRYLKELSEKPISSLYGVTDGKAVGTYVEHGFHSWLRARYTYTGGSSARGIDFPSLGLDLKVTSWRQPQSSCPFRSAEQKVYGLGYGLMVIVYRKRDDSERQVAYLKIADAIFVNAGCTGDYMTTKGILDMVAHGAIADDIDAFLQDRNLPLDDVGRRRLAETILKEPPAQGYLTISNALQWRLQYGRSLSLASTVGGIEKLL